MLDIIIVGASVFGLSAAVALRQKGHKVTVLESEPSLNGTGGNVVLLPCATKLLVSWGLEDSLAPHTTHPRCFQSQEGYTGEILGHAPCNKDDSAMITYGGRFVNLIESPNTIAYVL
jgi:salicylate hydroxylase